jgi:hypothetical protein
MMSNIGRMAAAALAAGLLMAGPAFALDIDNTPGGISNYSGVEFGLPGGSTSFGQTFVAGGSTMNNFSLFLGNRSEGNGSLDLRGYVGTWTGDKLGSLLYTSGTRSVNNDNLVEFVFDTGGITVTQGVTYVAFISISELSRQPKSKYYMPIANTNIAGNFVYNRSALDFGNLYTQAWIPTTDTSDAYFKAGFGAVPEPTSWALMICGFGLAGAALRRRRAVITA